MLCMSVWVLCSEFLIRNPQQLRGRMPSWVFLCFQAPAEYWEQDIVRGLPGEECLLYGPVEVDTLSWAQHPPQGHTVPSGAVCEAKRCFLLCRCSRRHPESPDTQPGSSWASLFFPHCEYRWTILPMLTCTECELVVYFKNMIRRLHIVIELNGSLSVKHESVSP